MGTPKEGTVWRLDTGTQTAATTKLWNALGSDGARVWQQLNDDEIYLDWIAEQMIASKIMSSPGYAAEAILGSKMFWGVEQWRHWYNVNLTRKEKLAIQKFPWGDDVLNSPCPFTPDKLIRDTHFAFLGLEDFHTRPLTISQWRAIVYTKPLADDPQIQINVEGVELDSFYIWPTCSFRWYLMPIDPIQCPAHSYKAKVRSLPAEYEVSTAVERVAQHILFYLLNQKISNTIPSVCSDAIPSECRTYAYRSYVRPFEQIRVRKINEGSLSHFGLSASRKLPLVKGGEINES